MEVIWFLIPLSILLVALAIRAFTWAVRTHQFEDLDREGARILFEEPAARHKRRSDD